MEIEIDTTENETHLCPRCHKVADGPDWGWTLSSYCDRCILEIVYGQKEVKHGL